MDDERDLKSAPPEELRDELERLRLLHTISMEFTASLDFDTLLPKVFDRVLTALGAQGGSIWIAEGDVLRCRLAMGGASQKLMGTTVPIGSGFVGDVARKQRSTIVSDAMRDPRFQMQSARMSGFVTTTLLATPMVTEGVTVGSIQVTNKVTDAGIFTDRDRELLEGLASSAAVALRNAQLHQAEKRARDLATLLEISREITSTLDMDRLLQSVVNLASRALTFDQAAIGLYQKGKCEIHAIAGEEQVDLKSERALRLATWGEWVARRGEPFYLSDRDAPGSDAEAAFTEAFGADLDGEGLKSGLYLPLKDEQGTLGVLMFESRQPDFISPTQRELSEILANQATVSLRNAELYNQVPLVDALGALAAKKRALMAMPRRRLQTYVVAAVVALVLVTLVRWPFRVGGSDPAFRASMYAEARALVPGVIERTFVREGTAVTRGAPLAHLRDAELRAEREAAAAAADVADRLAATARSRGNAAEEQLQRARTRALRREVALLDEQIAATTVRSPVSGVVLTARPEERIGTHLDAGDLVVALGRTDTLELNFGVEQREIGRVAMGQRVRVRVDALPQRTFEGSVTFVGQVPADSGKTVTFPVRVLVANLDGLLKPGMVAHAKVLTGRMSVAGRVLRGPVRWLRLVWWRIWA
ncbi:MAG: GAF domain-containing protein [Gemmatimonadetes bacterium]|nr:GAF domain-containing protein [Gemmatimonadota bacterium]